MPKIHRMTFALTSLVVCLALRSTDAAAGDFFRLDLGLAGSYAHGGKSWGGGASIEPKVFVWNQLAVGASFGGFVMAGADVGISTMSLSMQAVAPTLAKAEYYFIDSPIRPFVGLGLGIYYLATQGVSTGEGASVDQKGGAYFGLAPQAGVELAFCRLSVTYHAIIAAGIEVTQTVGTGQPSTRDISQNFLTFDLSFEII